MKTSNTYAGIMPNGIPVYGAAGKEILTSKYTLSNRTAELYRQRAAIKNAFKKNTLSSSILKVTTWQKNHVPNH